MISGTAIEAQARAGQIRTGDIFCTHSFAHPIELATGYPFHHVGFVYVNSEGHINSLEAAKGEGVVQKDFIKTYCDTRRLSFCIFRLLVPDIENNTWREINKDEVDKVMAWALKQWREGDSYNESANWGIFLNMLRGRMMKDNKFADHYYDAFNCSLFVGHAVFNGINFRIIDPKWKKEGPWNYTPGGIECWSENKFISADIALYKRGRKKRERYIQKQLGSPQAT